MAVKRICTACKIPVIPSEKAYHLTERQNNGKSFDGVYDQCPQCGAMYTIKHNLKTIKG